VFTELLAVSACLSASLPDEDEGDGEMGMEIPDSCDSFVNDLEFDMFGECVDDCSDFAESDYVIDFTGCMADCEDELIEDVDDATKGYTEFYKCINTC